MGWEEGQMWSNCPLDSQEQVLAIYITVLYKEYWWTQRRLAKGLRRHLRLGSTRNQRRSQTICGRNIIKNHRNVVIVAKIGRTIIVAMHAVFDSTVKI